MRTTIAILLLAFAGCSMYDLGRGFGEPIGDKLGEALKAVGTDLLTSLPKIGEGGAGPPASPNPSPESWWVVLAAGMFPLVIREIDKRFFRREVTSNGANK